MKTLDRLNIENYLEAENNEVRVGRQVVSFTADGGYPYRYEVKVEVDGRWKLGTATQNTEWDSAFHDGFAPAYREACQRLLVKPLIDE